MAAAVTSLTKALPKPKYTGEEEEPSAHAQVKGPRIVGAEFLDEGQVVLKVTRTFNQCLCRIMFTETD
jgi:SNW domain-containing protein 1